MIKVYVAKVEYDYDTTLVVGVFSTEEKAKDYLEKEYTTWGDRHTTSEFTLDLGE